MLGCVRSLACIAFGLEKRSVADVSASEHSERPTEFVAPFYHDAYGQRSYESVASGPIETSGTKLSQLRIAVGW